MKGVAMAWFVKMIAGLIAFIVVLSVVQQTVAAISTWVWVVTAIAVIVVAIIKFRGRGKGHGGSTMHHHFHFK